MTELLINLLIKCGDQIRLGSPEGFTLESELNNCDM